MRIEEFLIKYRYYMNDSIRKRLESIYKNKSVHKAAKKVVKLKGEKYRRSFMDIIMGRREKVRELRSYIVDLEVAKQFVKDLKALGYNELLYLIGP